MRIWRLMVALGTVLAVLLGCTDANPLYCLNSEDCPQGFVCIESIRTCVQPDGGQEEPAGGDGGDQTGDSDGEPVTTLWVDDNNCSDDGQGTRAEPFCSIGAALQHAGGSIDTIRVIQGEYQETLQIANDIDLIGDPGAHIQTTECPGILILGGARVTLEGFEITGAGGIRVTGQRTHADLEDLQVMDTDCYGLDCRDQASCFVERNTFFGNQEFGVRFENTTHVRLENNIIAQNGSGGQIGGLWIENPGAGSIFVNNTVAQNETELETNSGITCVTPEEIVNHIIWDNAGEEVTGSCSVSYSDVEQDMGDATNLNEDPRFVSEEDLHILPGSPCVDQASRASAPNQDIDGQLRPIGDGVDMGADEVR